MSILKKWAYSVAEHRKLQAALVIPKDNAPSSCDLYHMAQRLSTKILSKIIVTVERAWEQFPGSALMWHFDFCHISCSVNAS